MNEKVNIWQMKHCMINKNVLYCLYIVHNPSKPHTYMIVYCYKVQFCFSIHIHMIVMYCCVCACVQRKLEDIDKNRMEAERELKRQTEKLKVK